MKVDTAGELIRQARQNAGLTQRALARKARTAQSVIARTELGENSPAWDTLIRILRSAGFTLDVSLEKVPVVDAKLLDDVPRILAMSPQQRLEEVALINRFIHAARPA